mgnify:FL=1
MFFNLFFPMNDTPWYYSLDIIRDMFFYVDETFVDLGVEHHFHIFGKELFILGQL